jgi:branched-subunit amino acid transport protein
VSAVAQILLVGVGTYLIRVSAIALVGRFPEPSDSTRATMRLIGPAVLAAIVADRLFIQNGSVSVHWSWWTAAIIAAGVAYRWRSAGITMGIGMIAVWTLNATGLG